MGESSGGSVKCLNRPQEGPASRLYFAHKIFAFGSHHGGVLPIIPGMKF
jgi:hypothetical protein